MAKPYRRTLRKRTISVASALGIIAVIAVGYVILSPGRTVAPSSAAAASTTTTDTSGARCIKIDPVHPRLTPKPGFDPLTASDPQLQAQDFPPRPTNPDQLSVWAGYAEKYLAGEIINCATPGPGDIPPQLRTLAHVISLPPQPGHK